MTLSDRTLRRLAWAGWWFLTLVIAVQVPLQLQLALSPVTDHLLNAVRETVQPVHASVWLRT